LRAEPFFTARTPNSQTQERWSIETNSKKNISALVDSRNVDIKGGKV
jgi:hypothetical protein